MADHSENFYYESLGSYQDRRNIELFLQFEVEKLLIYSTI